MVREGDEVVRHRVEVLGQPGLESLRETWVRRIAAAFVRQTRLDPPHAGATTRDAGSGVPPGWLGGPWLWRPQPGTAPAPVNAHV